MAPYVFVVFFTLILLFLFFLCFRQKFLAAAGDAAQDKPVVVSKFILNAKEIEFDGVAQDGKILNYAISEHVEVHTTGVFVCSAVWGWWWEEVLVCRAGVVSGVSMLYLC